MNDKKIISKYSMKTILSISILLFILTIGIVVYFISPIIIKVSPLIVKTKDNVTIQGIGLSSKTYDIMVFIDDILIPKEYIKENTFFTIKFTLEQPIVNSLLNGGILYIKKRNKKSNKKLLIIHSPQKAPLPSLKNDLNLPPTFLTKEKKQNADNALFISKKDTIYPLSSYIFTLSTKHSSYTYFPKEWIEKDNTIRFLIPISLFTPSTTQYAILSIAHKNTVIERSVISLIPPPFINNKQYSFKAVIQYTPYKNYISPLFLNLKQWQHISISSKNPIPNIQNKIEYGYIKFSDNISTLTYAITRYTTKPIVLNSISIHSVSRYSDTTSIPSYLPQNKKTLPKENTPQTFKMIPEYLAYAYKNDLLYKKQNSIPPLPLSKYENLEDILKGSILQALLYIKNNEPFPLLPKMFETENSETIMKKIFSSISNDSSILNATSQLNIVGFTTSILRMNAIPARTTIGLQYISSENDSSKEKTSIPYVWIEILTTDFGWIPILLNTKKIQVDINNILEKSSEPSLEKPSIPLSLINFDYKFISTITLEQYTYLSQSKQAPALPEWNFLK